MTSPAFKSSRPFKTAVPTVKGTLIAPAVILRDGATFNGKIQVEKKGGTSKPAAKVNQASAN